ncbi:Pre-mRNA-processing factor 17 [Perkinsus olseni]|uniref:Pre-mRNA-processing factor 17 n=1 Tax=Perkinsus olseni TaxID=32597 RepID=A0A7J6UC35_PEROL|nr:Pre-mRNA-processing factor 17 [Perkinsus olseni]
MLSGYDSDNGSDTAERKKPVRVQLPHMQSLVAPDVNIDSMLGPQRIEVDSKTNALMTNPTARDLEHTITVMQKEDKNSRREGGAGIHFGRNRTFAGGRVEATHMSNFNFDRQYNTFQSFGFAEAPDGRLVKAGQGLTKREREMEGLVAKVDEERLKSGMGVFAGGLKNDESRKRLRNSDPADVDDFQGPWAGFEGEAEAFERHQAEQKERTDAEETKKKEAEEAEEKKKEELAEKDEKDPGSTTSQWHGSKPKVDYQGRSWMECPPQQTKKQQRIQARQMEYIEDEDDYRNKTCYLPKKWIHTWEGHTQGVQAIRFFPKTAHLLMSAGLDGTVKIWDYYNTRSCRITYTGHEKGVRDVQFIGDGTKFVSCSYDHHVNYWDTETGKIIRKFDLGSSCYNLAVHPTELNSFVVACHDKKAAQFDVNSPGDEPTQLYKDHLRAVNTVTICDDGKRLVTTSDDRKMFVWHWGIPVVDKYIAEPGMSSIPAVTVHPSQKFMACQSMNNQIVVYQAYGGFKLQGRKRFSGFNNTGYAIEPGFSADGRYLMSGDGDGRLHFWDWKSCKLYRTLKAHDGCCISCLWHPNQASRVVTAGWDGKIKLWD